MKTPVTNPHDDDAIPGQGRLGTDKTGLSIDGRPTFGCDDCHRGGLRFQPEDDSRLGNLIESDADRDRRLKRRRGLQQLAESGEWLCRPCWNHRAWENEDALLAIRAAHLARWMADGD